MLDTVVLIFALAGRSVERQIYKLCRASKFRMATSPPLLDELDRALRYPRFGFTGREIESVIRDILTHASVLRPRDRIDRIREDPDANRLLECAAAADADCLVTGDPYLLELHEHENTLILPAAAALSLLRDCL